MIERQTNFLGQMRVDVSILRAMESSVAGDFDVLAGNVLSGQQPLVVSGFKLTGITAGSPATSIQVLVAGSELINYNASESGSVFRVPSNRANETLNSTNPVVTGSWTASAINFVGVDLLRSADPTTADTLQFLSATTLTEVPKNVPLARTLNYRFVVSTTSFSAQPNIVPIAKVATDSSVRITAVEDCRNIMGRAAPGGDFAAINQGYSWPGGRAENLSGDVFSGGDKAIGSIREWMQAAMTRTWEVGGGEYWYSATADRGVTMVWTGSTFTDGENFEWDGTNLHWKGLKFSFDNSTGYFNDVQDQTSDNPGQTDLTDGQCVYVDLDRSVNHTGGTALVGVKANLSTLGPGTIPGSRWIIARRIGSSIYTLNWRYAVGTTFVPATATSLGVVKLSRNDSTPTLPVVISDAGGTIFPQSAVTVGLSIQGFAAQTADLLQFYNSVPTLLSSVDAAGNVVFKSATGTGQGVKFPDWLVTEDGSQNLLFQHSGSTVGSLNGGSGLWKVTNPAGPTTGEISSTLISVIMGSVTNHPLYLATNGTSQWKIDTSGNLVGQGGGHNIQIVSDPVNPQDAATKNYSDAHVEKNYCINGRFDFWQRTTSGNFDNGLGRTFVADRWYGSVTAAPTVGNWNMIRVVGSPYVTGEFPRAMKITRPNGDASVITTTYFVQEIDRGWCQHIQGLPVTLSFWAKKGANYASGLLNAGVTTDNGTGSGSNTFFAGYPGATVAFSTGVTLTGSWQQFVVSGTIASSITEGAIVFYVSPAGAAGGADDSFSITGVSLTVGSFVSGTAPPWAFSGGSLAGELQNCERYYEKNYNVDDIPGTAIGGGNSGEYIGYLVANTANTGEWKIGQLPTFRVRKRAVPGTVQVYTNTPATGSITVAGVDKTTTAQFPSETNFQLINSSGAGVGATGDQVLFFWTADAEI